MSEFEPITTLDDLATLDATETVEGYRDGLDGEPEPGDNRSRSYWHGWRNGALDGGHREKDAAQAELARVYCAAGRSGATITDADDATRSAPARSGGTD